MLSAHTKTPRKKASLVKLGGVLVAVVMVVVAVLLMQGLTFKEMAQGVHQFGRAAIDWVRSLGPWTFFAAMAVLPAFGFPISVFSLSAGSVFSEQLGLGWVIACVLVSLSLNLALTYWLARFAFRPLLEGIVKRLGYDLPRVDKEDHVSLTVVVRITPGPPFTVQGYLLGLADVPFWTYLWISWVISAVYTVAAVVFGQSLMQGSGAAIVAVVSVMIVLAVVIRWIRQKQARRRKERA